MITVPLNGQVADEPSLRAQLSSLRGLLVLSMLMFESGDETKILELAMGSVASLAPYQMVAARLDDSGWRFRDGPIPAAGLTEVEAQLDTLGGASGRVHLSGWSWALAYPLRARGSRSGHLVVGTEHKPSGVDDYLMGVLAQQTAAALANARLHRRDQEAAASLAAMNTALEGSVDALERSMRIHHRLTQITVSGGGQEGIATTIHELTGYPVAIEDRHGHLRAWAGPGPPDPYPKEPAARREQLLRRLRREARPVREGERLIALANPRHDVIGLLVLVDPAGTAGDHELVALEHGATVLAVELARMRSLAETELRVRRDLAEDLLAGTDEESALSRAEALGYDLRQPHQIAVFEGRGRARNDEAFFDAVRQSARDLGAGSLLVSRGGLIVLFAIGAPDWDTLHAAVLAKLGGGRCRIGVGGLCERPDDHPRSFREARLALGLGRGPVSPDVIRFDALGVCRLLCMGGDTDDLERFIQEWIGALIAYDQRRRAELVPTLAAYLEYGGNYDATSAALVVHRSTLKYRLHRIREISGLDLSDPDVRFNLQLATRAQEMLQALSG